MMLRYSVHILLLTLCLLSSGTRAQKFYNTEITAKIEIVESNGLFLISANASNLTELNRSIKYRFSIIKRDGSDNPNKEEVEGLFVVKPSITVNLNSYSVGVEQSQDILILLLIYDGDDLIGKDRLIIDEIKDKIPSVGDSNILNQALNKGESIGIRGLILEDTKTKAGRDFSRHFFQSHDIANITWPKDILIKEDFGLGRSTVIKIFEGTTMIVQFNAQPQDDYLRGVAGQCIQLVQQHFNKLARTQEFLTSY